MSESSCLKIRAPGLLWKPFGWAAAQLAPVVLANPALAIDLLSLDRVRMHLIALVLENFDQPPSTRAGSVP